MSDFDDLLDEFIMNEINKLYDKFPTNLIRDYPCTREEFAEQLRNNAEKTNSVQPRNIRWWQK